MAGSLFSSQLAYTTVQCGATHRTTVGCGATSGDDSESIHEFLKDKFAPKKVITVKGEAHTVPGCTHDLFTDNFFSDYVDRIRVWYAQDGGYIPDPVEVQP